MARGLGGSGKRWPEEVLMSGWPQGGQECQDCLGGQSGCETRCEHRGELMEKEGWGHSLAGRREQAGWGAGRAEWHRSSLIRVQPAIRQCLSGTSGVREAVGHSVAKTGHWSSRGSHSSRGGGVSCPSTLGPLLLGVGSSLLPMPNSYQAFGAHGLPGPATHAEVMAR